MKKLNLTIVIPTRNRLELLTKTLMHLKRNNFFFKEVIIVDSSDKLEKKKVNKLKNSTNLKIKVLDCLPGISRQRNKGLRSASFCAR